MVVKKNQSALLAKYQGMYQKNPRSRVFAPLAESLRKLGMLEEAYKILKDGIRYHPNYVLGYIVLAHCYFDEEKFDLVYSTLRPIVHQNADNISLQKLFARSCIHLGHLEEALDVFKYLLFMNPRDKYFAEQVKKLEDDLLVDHKKLTLNQMVKSPERAEVPSPQSSFEDDWVQIDFNQTTREIQPPESSDENWMMQKSSFDHPILKTETITQKDLEDEFYADEFEQVGEIDQENEQISTEAPIISHTLIDLYCNQKYYDKAIELLEKIIELNPDDVTSIRKLESVRSVKKDDQDTSLYSSEEDGHDELISLIEEKVKVKSSGNGEKQQKIHLAYQYFLDLIKERAAAS